MSTAIAILGGVGLFLLGMTVMTDGLKALAGSALRTVLGKAAATQRLPRRSMRPGSSMPCGGMSALRISLPWRRER